MTHSADLQARACRYTFTPCGSKIAVALALAAFWALAIGAGLHMCQAHKTHTQGQVIALATR